MSAEDRVSVSPYLLRPLRSYEETLRDRLELERLREAARRHGERRFAALQAQLQGVGD